MLAALLMMFFLGGAAVSGSVLTQPMLDDIDERVRAAVTDPARAARATAELEGLRAELGQFEKGFGNSSKSLAKLYRDHGADAVELRAQLDTLDSEWETAQSRALDHRFALRDSMTREEWNEVFGEP